jgi:hypothetical protein
MCACDVSGRGQGADRLDARAVSLGRFASRRGAGGGGCGRAAERVGVWRAGPGARQGRARERGGLGQVARGARHPRDQAGAAAAAVRLRSCFPDWSCWRTFASAPTRSTATAVCSLPSTGARSSWTTRRALRAWRRCVSAELREASGRRDVRARGCGRDRTLGHDGQSRGRNQGGAGARACAVAVARIFSQVLRTCR